MPLAVTGLASNIFWKPLKVDALACVTSNSNEITKNTKRKQKFLNIFITENKISILLYHGRGGVCNCENEITAACTASVPIKKLKNSTAIC